MSPAQPIVLAAALVHAVFFQFPPRLSIGAPLFFVFLINPTQLSPGQSAACPCSKASPTHPSAPANSTRTVILLSAWFAFLLGDRPYGQSRLRAAKLAATQMVARLRGLLPHLRDDLRPLSECRVRIVLQSLGLDGLAEQLEKVAGFRWRSRGERTRRNSRRKSRMRNSRRSSTIISS